MSSAHGGEGSPGGGGRPGGGCTLVTGRAAGCGGGGGGTAPGQLASEGGGTSCRCCGAGTGAVFASAAAAPTTRAEAAEDCPAYAARPAEAHGADAAAATVRRGRPGGERPFRSVEGPAPHCLALRPRNEDTGGVRAPSGRSSARSSSSRTGGGDGVRDAVREVAGEALRPRGAKEVALLGWNLRCWPSC